jgi:hypothetical protein
MLHNTTAVHVCVEEATLTGLAAITSLGYMLAAEHIVAEYAWMSAMQTPEAVPPAHLLNTALACFTLIPAAAGL